MFEIIPNWHPIFVHFAIGLLSISAAFHVVAVLNSKSTNYYQFETVANWNLWVGATLAIVTVIAGWFAYNSVEHDTPSHLAMTDHRNWRLGTASIFIALAIWSFQRARKSIPIGWLLAALMVMAAGLLATTGWKGGELVYKHGLGVMSLPKSEHDGEGGEAHDHGDAGHGSSDMSDESMSSDADAAHEVGESEHGHTHESADAENGGSDNDGVDTDGEPVTKPSATSTIPEKAKVDSRDHGDHRH